MERKLRDVAILGVGMTKFGRHPDRSLTDLFGEAAMKAIKESNIDKKKIQAIFLGQHVGEITDGASNLAPFVSTEIGLPGIPANRYEAACASSSVAFREAYFLVATGIYDIVLVGGTERLLSAGTPIGTKGLATSVDGVYEGNAGLTFPGVFGMAAMLYSKKYEIPLDELRIKMAYVSVKNHKYGAKNPLAQWYGKYGDLKPEDVVNSRMIAYPLTLLDCCPMTDGATACVLASADIAERVVDKPIYVLGVGQGSAGGLYRQKDITMPQSRIKSSRMAFEWAGIGPEDVDVVELHDCFTIAEIIASEAMGFFEWGTGADAVEKGETWIGGKLPINPSGGLIGKGHPVGATGTAQIYALVKQLRNEVEPRELQVHGAEVGMTDTLGGDFGTICNVILSTKRRGEV
ncbi:3-ketoacyl-CoA thiolase [Candidatus Bathyarchaeota archaeon]|nr:MAG: 3-ketoacyl-CoA thiolase [Candidatus Bathyarchaeota archaeon]